MQNEGARTFLTLAFRPKTFRLRIFRPQKLSRVDISAMIQKLLIVIIHVLSSHTLTKTVIKEANVLAVLTSLRSL